MSIQLINQYYNKRDRIIQYGGSTNELTIRGPFKELLNHYADKKNLLLIPELAIMGTKGAKVKPDGTLKNALRLDYGYWESKDEKDSIDEEIDTKIKKGYPLTNIMFEDGQTAVLIQHGDVVARVDMNDRNKLDEILNQFISFEHPQVKEFTEALVKFKEDLPNILEALRELMIKQGKTNPGYVEARDKFLDHCRQEINPEFTPDDVREMIIQHILTEEIFNAVFDETHFHRENNIARELENVIGTFFTGETRRNTLEGIKHYYSVISNNARNMADHHEKQKFLKVIYENFYKTYNPKAADRLGVVYTPNEIVNFMIESTDYLLQKHFDKTLADKNVEILDPATGTGTFICDIIDYIPKQYLLYKYKNEIHANEVAILPYYVANLNIEYTYKQKMGYYEEFPNLCFVDTLDNTGALKYKGQQVQMFGFSSENASRIKRQNEKKISVIIGNPPYNANQKNENENNKNREYNYVDKRIKDTYIKESTAQKTKLYDMYARFYRWASDRLDKNGVLAFITNRSFINSRTYDGFRKCIYHDFSECYIIDTKSDVRMNPKIAGTTHNVFGIQTGVALMFLVKKELQEGKCKIYYMSMQDEWRKEIKLDWLRNNNLKTTTFDNIVPDKNNNWINLTDNDFDSLLPLANKETKLGKGGKALFELYSLGTVSNRDEWVYSFNIKELKEKTSFLVSQFNQDIKTFKGKINTGNVNNNTDNSLIKYTRDLKKRLLIGKPIKIIEKEYRECHYRVFNKRFIYFAPELNEMRYQMPVIFPQQESKNIIIAINQASKAFNILASQSLVDLHFNGDSQCFPLYRYDNNGKQEINITDWGLEQFRNKYKDKKITKSDIFNYIYAVLHNPAYRKKYELNLKREFPRIPFYKDFWKWAKWGKALLDLHINYEEEKPFPLKRIDLKITEKQPKQKEFFPKVKEPEPMFGIKPKIKVKLRADKTAGTIEIDDITTLSGIPKEAWDYKLGNRSALEWILDQYKEKKPKDPTIAEKFNCYRFADYKEEVIQLLSKITTISLETMKIISQMSSEKE
jgi:predicted helicase